MRRLLLPALVLLVGCIPAPRAAGIVAPAAAMSDDEARDRRAFDMAPRDEAPERHARTVPDLGQEDDRTNDRDADAGAAPITPAAVAASRPAWSARAVAPDARTVTAQRYVVKPGDTLRRVADVTGSSSEGIARENGLAAPFTIRAGQALRIPGGRYHTVRAGESGIAIARAYGIEWSRIVAVNALEEPYVLRTGQRLLLPEAREAHRSTLEERAAAFTLDIDDLITGSEPALASAARPAAPVATARRAVPAALPVAEPSRFAGRFDWPLTGPILTRFGPQGGGRVNEGINIAASAGTPIRAAADGVVAYVGSEIAVFGGLILLKHGDGWITTYGHAERLLVTRGQKVRRGQIIARAGETGSVREPQLHFEIRKGRRPVDPLGELPART